MEKRRTPDAGTLRNTLDVLRTLMDLVREPGMERLWPWSAWPDDLESFERRLREELQAMESREPPQPKG